MIDIITKGHRVQSGFANTDLDHQPKDHGIKRIVILASVAHARTESTGRFGMEIGFHPTLAKNATHQINGTTFAHAIVTTSERLAAFSKASNSSPTAADPCLQPTALPPLCSSHADFKN